MLILWSVYSFDREVYILTDSTWNVASCNDSVTSQKLAVSTKGFLLRLPDSWLQATCEGVSCKLPASPQFHITATQWVSLVTGFWLPPSKIFTRHEVDPISGLFLIHRNARRYKDRAVSAPSAARVLLTTFLRSTLAAQVSSMKILTAKLE